MVLTEVLQNAVEHGYPAEREGSIEVAVRRAGGRLEVAVVDDGAGLPEGFTLDGSTNLGLSIVRTLVESELGGRLALGPARAGRPDAGTRAAIDVPLD